MKSKALKIQRHPLSALFSRCDLAGDDLQALADDIKTNGQRQTITSYEGMILDGWNRYQACLLAKVKPRIEGLEPGYDPWEFVKGANMLRRHMSPAERVAVMLLYFQLTGEDQGEDDEPECPKSGTPSTRQIAKDLEVSKGTAGLAKQVMEAHDPALNAALADKKVSLEEAADLAKLPAQERRAALETPEPKKAPKPSKNAQRLAQRLADEMAEAGASPEEIAAATAPGGFLDPSKGRAPQSVDFMLSEAQGQLDGAREEIAYLKKQGPIDRARLAQLENLLPQRDEEIKELTRKLEEAGAQVQELAEENAAMHRILDAEDLLAQFKAEVVRAQALARTTEERFRGVQNKNKALERSATSWKRKFEALERKVKGKPEPPADPELESDEYLEPVGA